MRQFNIVVLGGSIINQNIVLLAESWLAAGGVGKSALTGARSSCPPEVRMLIPFSPLYT